MRVYAKVKKSTKEVKVFKPEQCPFRYTAGIYGNCEEDFCGYLKSLHKIVEKRITFDGYTVICSEHADAICFCTDDQWIEGCPLLNDNFQIVKN